MTTGGRAPTVATRARSCSVLNPSRVSGPDDELWRALSRWREPRAPSCALPGSPVRPLLELFQALLEHRFGADVGDHRSTLVAATDDIGIRR
jgi:hypothetical protein